MHRTLNTHTYNEPHCWQYHIRRQNLNDDLIKANLSIDQVKKLKVSDFKFEYVPKENQILCQEIKKFIERHEWLGKMPTRPTHRFIATYKGHLAGVVVMATPNAFSNLLGPNNKHLEKLISRGSCISWSPKNLASSLIMYAIRYMVKNTEFRFFTAYSDTDARELGTIYQACNFIYLGQSSGARHTYVDPINENTFSDRLFRKTSFIKRKAQELNITWEANWHKGDKILWENIPYELTLKIKSSIKDYQNSCNRKSIPYKHKYVYILGSTKTETKKLKELFIQVNPDKVNLAYPKVRGPVEQDKNQRARPCRILKQELTKRPNPCWPSNNENFLKHEPIKKFHTIKEVANMYGISIWLLYSHIKSDPNFPVINLGLKKKFMIDLVQFEIWMKSKTKVFLQEQHQLPSSKELMEV